MFLCLPPYNLNFKYFEIKSLVPRTLNLRDLTVQYSLVTLDQNGEIYLFSCIFQGIQEYLWQTSVTELTWKNGKLSILGACNISNCKPLLYILGLS